MTEPTLPQLFDLIDTTWPPAAQHHVASCVIRDGQGGGSRVSAATTDGPFDPAMLAQAEAAMRDLGQTPLFMIRGGEDTLDGQLDAAGYVVKDPVWLYLAPVGVLMSEQMQPVSTFRIWPPLRIVQDIWAEGGIGAERVAIMTRATCAKTTLLGRVDDAPAAAGYVGCDGAVAMLHALEVRPEHRRKSMGARMTRAAAFWAAEQGANHLALLVTQANAGANALYRSLGMQVAGQYHYRIKVA